MNDDPRQPYGTPIPPRREQGSLLPPNFTSSPLHPMDTLNPDHNVQPQQPAQTVITPEQLITPGPPPTRPWEPPVSNTPPPSPTGKSFKRKFIIMIVLVVLLLICAGLYFATTLTKKTTSRGANTGNLSVAALAKQGKLTAATVTSLDARNYFKSVVGTLARQQTQHLTQEVSTMISANTRPENFLSLDLSDTTYNYKTQALSVLVQHQQSETAQNAYFVTCFNKQTYTYLPTSTQRTWQVDGTQNYCDPLQATVARTISDGTNTGGLTAEQAIMFTNALFNTMPKDVVTASTAQLVTRDNKQYIKMQAKISAVNVGTTEAPKWQGQTFVANAFKTTGIDSAVWPFYADGAASSGRMITMYINPETSLPVYAEYITNTGTDDKTGKASPATVGNVYRLDRVQYAFGGSMPEISVSQAPDTIAISWPAENR